MSMNSGMRKFVAGAALTTGLLGMGSAAHAEVASVEHCDATFEPTTSIGNLALCKYPSTTTSTDGPTSTTEVSTSTSEATTSTTSVRSSTPTSIEIGIPETITNPNVISTSTTQTTEKQA